VPLDVDPVGALLRPGLSIGTLAIELETRRRLRVNGTVAKLDDSALALAVRESFPNCPKYIAQRHLYLDSYSTGLARVRDAAPSRGVALDTPRRATIESTDTVFVGSLHPTRGADVSHRGGNPGFVRVVDDRTLRIPDYSGNSMFQTLGNIHVTGRAGLTFVSFEGRKLLHLTGTATLRFDQDEKELVTGGTCRSWDLHIQRWVEGALPSALHGELLERSRLIPES
jgi:hypothetical protein